MRVLIACECSGVLRDAFRALGCDAWSCDLVPADDGSLFHIQGNCLDAMTLGWDIIISHPPCTYLTRSGIHWNARGRGWTKTHRALDFVRAIMAASSRYARIGWCVENPVGLISTHITPATQYVQPYEFGDDASKETGLWLHNLPTLTIRAGNRTPPRFVGGLARWGNQTDSGNNRLGQSPGRAQVRSRTYPGMAAAMASEWHALTPIPPQAEFVF